MNKLVLVTKKNKLLDETLEFDNVVQLDFCNMQEVGDDISDSGWNFISILIRDKNNELKKTMLKIEDIWQFSIVKQKEQSNG